MASNPVLGKGGGGESGLEEGNQLDAQGKVGGRGRGDSPQTGSLPAGHTQDLR